MSVGVWASLGGVVCFGIANTAMNYIAKHYEDNFAGLIWQYVFVTIAAMVYVSLFSLLQGGGFFPVMTPMSRGVLGIVAVTGFVGIGCLYEGFDHLTAAVNLVIANTAVFFMYFLNLWVFSGSENLPWLQVVLGVVFFGIIAQFLLSGGKGYVLRTATLWPLATAVCWSIFFVGNTWFVKEQVMTPVQSVFMTESSILVMGLLYYAIKHRGSFAGVRESFLPAHVLPLVLIGICVVGGGYLFYVGYLHASANMVNVIRLFSIAATAVLSWVFLGEHLTRKQLWLLTAALAVMVLFVAVG